MRFQYKQGEERAPTAAERIAGLLRPVEYRLDALPVDKRAEVIRLAYAGKIWIPGAGMRDIFDDGTARHA